MTTLPPLGIFSWFGSDFPLPERLGLIKRAGFEVTSIWWGDEEELVRKQQRNSIPDMVRDVGLTIENMHIPWNRCNELWSEDSSERESVIDLYRSWIDDCATHRIPMMVMHVAQGVNIAPPNGHGIDSMEALTHHALNCGVTLAVENTKRLDYLDAILSTIESPALRFCYDSSHDWLFNHGSSSGILSKYGHLLAATHLSDNGGSLDNHWLPGEGKIDWDTFANEFPSKSYTGNLVLEVFQRGLKSVPPTEFLAKAYSRIQWLAGLVTSQA